MSAQETVLTQVEMRFRGKTVMENGKPKLDEKTGEKIVVKERENFSLQLPLLTMQGLMGIAQEGSEKAKDALLLAINSVIIAQAKKQVDEGVNAQSELDLTKLSWEVIAELSASDLSDSSAAPSKEVLEKLAADYIAIMPTVLGVSTEVAKAAAKEFQNKFRTVKLRPDLLERLHGRLVSWFSSTEKTEEFAEAFEWLSNKATSYIEEGRKASMADLF